MAKLRFALAQHDFPVGDVAGNAARMTALAEQAQAAGAGMVAFPELALCGYPPEDLLLRPSFLRACDEALQHLAASSGDCALLVGHPFVQGEGYNAASLLRDAGVQATCLKQDLPNYAVFDEKRYFHAGQQTSVVDIDGVRMGLLICEDIWRPGPAARATAAGAQVLLVINASPYDLRHLAARERMLEERAGENGVPIAFLNLVGAQDDLLFDGASLLASADGRIVARAPSFLDALLMVEFDSETGTMRALDWPDASAQTDVSILYSGLVRGVRDYIDKNGFPGVLLGLSGGIDSALTLAIAVDALGADRVMAVMLPSRYTSQLSLDSARAQAEAAGVEYHVLPIESAFTALNDTLMPAFAGKAADTTEENLQSRIRGAMLMALSNKHGRLLLATGNKSEMAVGYATLYGDMCGAFAPLKDVYKTRVYELARWRNEAGTGDRRPGTGTKQEFGVARGAALLSANSAGREDSRESGAMPGPRSPVPGPSWVIPPEVIERAPSAELRAEQTDQDSLPEYAQLDAILERFIEHDQSPAEIVAAGFESGTVDHVVRLVLGNEFKRRQSAPGPRISRRAFGRERRYPITSAWR